MAHKTHLLKVEFDPTRNVIDFVTDRTEPLGTWDLSITVDGADQLEQAIGHIVLAALSTLSGQAVGTRDYRAERSQATPIVLDHFRRRLLGGEEEAIISMVNELTASAVRNSDLDDIDRADKLLREAAQAGNSKAIEYLATSWSRDKQDITRSIKRQTGMDG